MEKVGELRRVASTETTDSEGDAEPDYLARLKAFAETNYLSSDDSLDDTGPLSWANCDPFFDELQAKFDQFVGMQSLKKTVLDYVTVALVHPDAFKRLTARGAHTIISGNPGTGKTTVAQMWAWCLWRLGIVTNLKRQVQVKVATLIRGVVGGSQVAMLEQIQASRGSTLILDEAHMLASQPNAGSGGDFYGELFRALFNNMDGSADEGTGANRDGKFTAVLMGYDVSVHNSPVMNDLYKRDPGLERRIPFKFALPDYTCLELSEMMIRKLKQCKIGDVRVQARQLQSPEPATPSEYKEFRLNYYRLLVDKENCSEEEGGSWGPEFTEEEYKNARHNHEFSARYTAQSLSQWYKNQRDKTKRGSGSTTPTKHSELAELRTELQKYHPHDGQSPKGAAGVEHKIGCMQVAWAFDLFSKEQLSSENGGLVDQVLEQLALVETDNMLRNKAPSSLCVKQEDVLQAVKKVLAKKRTE